MENDTQIRAESMIALLKIFAIIHEHKHLQFGQFPHFTKAELNEKFNIAFKAFMFQTQDVIVEWLKSNPDFNKRALT